MAGLDDIQLNIVVALQGDTNIDRLTRKMDGIARAADGVVRKQDAIVAVNRKTIRSWDDLTYQLGEVERRYDALFRAGVHMTQMGRDLIGVSEKIIGLGVGIVTTYADYDFMLRRAAVALNTNEHWQSKLNDAITESAQAIGLFSPEQVAEGYYIWGAAAGMVVDTQEELAQITGVVEDTMIATAMAGGSLEGNLNGVYAVMSQFDLPMERAGDVVHGLALMTERTAASFSDLTGAMTFIGPFADEMGVQFEDIVSMLGMLADNGTRGSRAGRGLQMMLEGLSAPSGPAKEALNSVAEAAYGAGTAFEDMVFTDDGQFVGMRQFVMDMAKGLKDMTQQERGYVYAKGFTNNATRAFIPLINEQIALMEKGADANGEFTSALDAQKYTLEGAGHFFETMRDQATGSINAIIGSLRNSFFPLLQMVATRIMEMATPVIDRIKAMVDVFTQWVKQNPEIVELAVKIGALFAVITGIAGGFFLFAGSLSLLIATFGVVSQGIGRVIAPFMALAAVVGGLAVLVFSDFGGIRTAFENLGDAIAGFIEALDLPDLSITGILTSLWELVEPRIEEGVRALAGAIEWLADEIRFLTEDKEFMAWASEIVGWVATFVVAATGLRIFATGLGTLTGALWAFRIIWDGLVKLLMAGPIIGVFKLIGGAVAGIAGAFMALSAPLKFLVGGLSLVGLALGAAFLAYETNFLGFRDFVNGIIAWLVETVPGVISGVIGFFQTLGSNVVTIWNNIMTVVGPIMQGFIAPFVMLAERGIPALITKLQEFWAAVSPIFMSIRDTVIEVFTNVVIPAWEGLLLKIQEFVAFVVPLIADFVGSFVQFATDLIGFFFAPIVDNWNMIVGVIGIAAGIIFGIVLEMVELILGVVGPWVESFIRIVGVLWETVTGLFSAALDIIMGIFQTVFGTLSEIFKAFSALFRGDLGAFWEHVTAAFWTAVDGILRIIGGLVSGIWTAFTGMVATVWELITGFLSGMLGLFPEFVGDIVRFGGDIVKGIWEGISNFARWLWTKITGWLGDIVDGVKDFLGIRSPSTIFAKMGENLVRGLWNGISNFAGWLWDKITGWVGGIVDGVMGLFDMGSPSKLFAEIGMNLVKGMAIGIDGTPDAANSMNAYANQIIGIGEALESAGSGFQTEFSSSAGLSLESDSERRVRIELDLTSSDGSYDDATLEQLKTALTGSDLVRALERMSEAG